MQPANSVSRKPPVPEKPPVNWGYEIKNAFRIMGKVLFKAFSYILNILLTVMLIALITGIIVGSAMAIYIKNYIDPEIDTSLFPVGEDRTTRIYIPDPENDGQYIELEDERLYNIENGIWANYKDMPEHLIFAFVAIEDKRFVEHNGFDIYRSGNAVLEFLTSFSFKSGGSTITQQLVKNITDERDVRVQRKIEEIFRAMNLEKQKTKEEILELYLNIIPLGSRCTGVQAAANYYFGKDVSELTLLESACIAAITNSPTYYNPSLYEDHNKERRNTILKEMYKQGIINKTEYEENYDKDIVLNLSTDSPGTAEVKTNSYYKDALITKIVEDLMAEKGYSLEAAWMMVYTAGFQIYTTLDMEIQEILEDYYEDDSNFKSVGQGIQPESAMVVVDPYTGYVVGLVGGRGEKTLNLGLNRATDTTRPPGSAIKPISVYAPALDQGLITYGTPMDDAPVNFGTSGKKVAWPKNLPPGYQGLITIHSALRESKNTVAVRLLDRVGIENSFKFMKEDLSVNSLIASKELASGRIISDKDIAALALGQLNYGLTVEEITAAYAIFQNDGIFNEPRLYTKVYDSLGNIVLDNDPKTRIVISAQSASIMTIMLKDVVDNGTAKCITLKNTIEVAGKTGTSSTDYDRWFVGYTPYYVAGVWFGYDMPQSLTKFSATSPPSAVIWDEVMTKIHQKYIDEAANGGTPLRTFKLATGVIEAEYCMDSGKKPTDACRKYDIRGKSRVEVGYFTKQTAPSESCDVHVMVNMCRESGAIAYPGYCYCPNTYKAALIRIENAKAYRSFPTYVQISDAGYVYRDLPEGVAPYTGNGPFFQRLLSNGEYIGSSGVAYNRICTLHYGTWTPPAETESEETTAEPPDDNTGQTPIDTPEDNKKEEETVPDNSNENITPPETDPPSEPDGPDQDLGGREEETTEFVPEPWDVIIER